jgi:hypothetical protein
MVLKRAKQFILRLNMGEAHKLQTLAADADVSISDWLRININNEYEVKYGSKEEAGAKTKRRRTGA